jgi:hypothetical protein
MKNILIGLVLGILLTGVVCYFVFLPDIKDKTYKTAYDEGSKKGFADGRDTGMAAGITATEQKFAAAAAHERDSLATVQKNMEEMQKAAQKKHTVKQVQNWHVIDNQIGDPIVPEKKEKK